MSSLYLQDIEFYLPREANWYNYQTGLPEPSVGQWNHRMLSDLEQGLFVKGGSVLPILKHEGCMALLSCFQNPILLRLFLDTDFNAYGNLYLDDGETLNYWSDSGSALIKFNFESGTLTSYFEYGSGYPLPVT